MGKIISPSDENRWVALDVFRGLTIASMIVVNNPGDYRHEYHELGHAKWHGITFSDFIFPFFLFIMGLSIALSIPKQLEKGMSVSTIQQKIFKRTILLFLLGLTVSVLVYPATGGFRVAGVLQRIALVYWCCSMLFLYTSWRTQLVTGIVLLIGYWMLLALVPVPGTGSPSLEPVNNLVSWFDRKYLPGMLYDEQHDPEGILSTIPAIVSGLIGVLTGQLSASCSSRPQLIRNLGFTGILSLSIGLIWQLYFPLNKNLWTSSFVLVTGGAALMVLSVITWLIDVKGFRPGTKPFIVFGSNAIASYMLSFVLLYLVFAPFFRDGKTINAISNAFLLSLGCSPNFSSLIWAFLYTGLCYIPVSMLYKKKIFLKV